eukprot:1946894-Alexandrium_andersonii.AAC.1
MVNSPGALVSTRMLAIRSAGSACPGRSTGVDALTQHKPRETAFIGDVHDASRTGRSCTFRNRGGC